MIEPARIHVRFSDLDILGHVNNNIYLSYFEIARVHYFGKLLGQDWNWNRYTFVLAKNEVEYIKPVLLHHQPVVYLYCEKVGTKSFELSYELLVRGEIFAKGRSVAVSYDAKEQKSMEIHPEVKKVLHQLKKEQ